MSSKPTLGVARSLTRGSRNQAGQFRDIFGMIAPVLVARGALLAQEFVEIACRQAATPWFAAALCVKYIGEEQIAQRYLEMPRFPVPFQFGAGVTGAGYLLAGVGRKSGEVP